MSSQPVPLSQCEKLNAVLYEECTRFNRFVLLKPKPKDDDSLTGGSGSPPVATLPTDYKFRDRRRITQLARRADDKLRDLRVRFPVVVPDPVPNRPDTGGHAGKRPVLVSGLGEVELSGRKLDRAQRLQAMKSLFPATVITGPVMRSMGSLPAQFGLKPDLDGMLDPIVKAVRDFAQMATEAQSKAVWAIGLDFRQCWHSQGYLRGRLVRSLPLTPGEQLEIVIKTWDRRTERKSEVESVARQLSNEITGEEKWMLATKMLFGDQTNVSVNPSAGANGDVSIPIDTVTANLGGNLGVAGNFADQLSQSTESGTQYIHDSIVKAAQSLSATRTNTVELGHEVGEEVTRKQTIANTNRCHTLTYHYFEVLERFTVQTRFNGASLYLLIPLPVPDITEEWVLCHECYLRKVLPCETYYAGFAAAKTLLAWQKLGVLYPPATTAPPPGTGGGGKADDFASPFSAAVNDVLDRWHVLRDAEMLSIGSSAAGDDLLADIAAGGQAIADGLGKLATDVVNGVEGGIAAAGEAIDEGLQTVGNAVQAAGNALGGLAGAMFSVQPQMMAFSLGGNVTRGGAGTWLYREVAKLAAPQIADAFSFLDTAWPGTQSVAPSARGLAEFNVLLTFFAKLGAPAATFGKVDALFVGAAAAAVGKSVV